MPAHSKLTGRALAGIGAVSMVTFHRHKWPNPFQYNARSNPGLFLLDSGDRSPLSHWETCLPVTKRGHVRALQTTDRALADASNPIVSSLFGCIFGLMRQVAAYLPAVLASFAAGWETCLPVTKRGHVRALQTKGGVPSIRYGVPLRVEF